jgi:hypothetical protein
MNHRRSTRAFRPKAWTWLEPDAQPSAPHVTVDPSQLVVLSRAPDEEGRFVVIREQEGVGPTRWVGDRRHWTEVPPADPAE